MTVGREGPVTIAGVAIEVEVRRVVRAGRIGGALFFEGEAVPVAVRIGAGPDAVVVRLDEERPPPERGSGEV